ncbi:MAG: zf-HC2 domain-containing protein [Armatimonadota bacterium]|nr:zf-HC2 domain-containing protein [Armatimonadota bacterium]
MKCSNAKILISAAADGELTERERLALDEHLAECVDCRRERSSVGALRRTLAVWEAEEPAESLANAFALRLKREQEQRTKGWRSLLLPRLPAFGLASAAAAAVLVLAYAAVQPRYEGPAPRRPALVKSVPGPDAPQPPRMAAMPAPETPPVAAVMAASSKPAAVTAPRAPRKARPFRIAGRRHPARAPAVIALAPATVDAAKALAESARLEAVRRVTEKAARLRSLIAEADITIESALLRSDVEVLDAHDLSDLDAGGETPG